VYAESIYIDLKRWYQIGRVVIEFEGRIISPDEIQVWIRNDQATAYHSVGTITGGSSATLRIKEFYTSFEASQLQLKIAFLGGTPKIRNIEVWGDPLTAPTHTRA
jgi:hypothetical protein